MDSRIHWTGNPCHEMTFEKAGCEIKKGIKYVQKLILEKNESGITALFFRQKFVKNNLNKYEQS